MTKILQDFSLLLVLCLPPLVVSAAELVNIPGVYRDGEACLAGIRRHSGSAIRVASHHLSSVVSGTLANGYSFTCKKLRGKRYYRGSYTRGCGYGRLCRQDG